VSLTLRQPSAESVGERLRRLRLERGLSQRELSGPGVSYAYISRIEAGERRPSVKALRVLAAKLGVSAEYLETGSEISAEEARELRLADAELQLRLGDDGAEVKQALEALLDEAASAGDSAHATRARVALGLAAAQSGRHEEAVRLLEEAVAGGALPPQARPEVYGTLGQSYDALGRFEDAVALFERCLAHLREHVPADDASYVRFATYLSFVLTDSGDNARAEQVMKEALTHVKRSTDPYTRVRIYWSLARVSDVEGKALAALDYMRRAIALLEATDDTLHLARAHVMCARIELGQEAAHDALAHLEVAESLFGQTIEPLDRGLVRQLGARQALLAGDAQHAEALAREALEALGPHHEGERGETLLALADALAAQRRAEDAERTYREAIALLQQHNRERELAQAYGGLGRLLESVGRAGEARDVLAHAQQLTPTE
jgi:tetratricopeptide (TPR) repeat protein